MGNAADVVAETLIKSGVKRVHGLPGDSLSGFTNAIRRSGGELEWMDKGARTAMLAAKAAALPVRRVGSPEDVADAVLFHESNGFVTGSTLLIDGGGSVA